MGFERVVDVSRLLEHPLRNCLDWLEDSHVSLNSFRHD